MKENEKFVETALKEIGNAFEKYGLNDEWCARFVSWCAEKCNYVDKYFVFTDGAGTHAREGVSHKYGEFKLADGKYLPQVGDCVLYRYSDDSKYNDIYHSDHIGIVVHTRSNGLYFDTVEGNTCGTNYKNTSVNRFNNRYVLSKNVHGFYVPKFNKLSEKAEKAEKYIKFGDIDNISYMLKTLLKLLYFSNIIHTLVDDKKGFGEKTLQAVKEFQQKYNLEVDGVVGYQTLQKMREVLLNCWH